jgi:DNA-directed RNA polymerase specialized sigma24 family protein
MGRKSKELSPDKKEVIVNLKSNGHKISEIARMLSIPESTCRSVIKTCSERKSLKKLIVPDVQEKCLLGVKPD